VNPARLDPGNVNNVLTCDQNHSYTPEQEASDNGLPENTAASSGNDPEGQPCTTDQVMDYYDGNVVTALWNYTQHFAMSDDNFRSNYGPSTEGALNVISGDTGGVDTVHAVRSALTNGDAVTYTNPDGGTGTTLIGDDQPYWDDCSTGAAVALEGREHRRPAELEGPQVGLVPGRLHPELPLLRARDVGRRVQPVEQPGRCLVHRGQQRRGGPWGYGKDRGEPLGDHGELLGSLRRFPVLRVHRQPAPPRAGVA
jgi:phospholipase C